MNPQERSESPEEQAAMIASGAATPEEAAAIEPLLADRDEITEFADVVSHLAQAISELAPPPSVRIKLLAQLGEQHDKPHATPAVASALPGLLFRFAHEGDFSPTPYPGVSARMLHVDGARRQFSVMLKLEPGAVYPAHAHDGPEECIVLEGEILVGNVRMRPGDYQRAEPGSRHIEQRSETGALLFLTAPLSLLEPRQTYNPSDHFA